MEPEYGTNLLWVWKRGQGQFPDFPVEEIVERELQGIPESEKEALRTIPLNFKVLVDPIEEAKQKFQTTTGAFPLMPTCVKINS